MALFHGQQIISPQYYPFIVLNVSPEPASFLRQRMNAMMTIGDAPVARQDRNVLVEWYDEVRNLLSDNSLKALSTSAHLFVRAAS